MLQPSRTNNTSLKGKIPPRMTRIWIFIIKMFSSSASENDFGRFFYRRGLFFTLVNGFLRYTECYSPPCCQSSISPRFINSAQFENASSSLRFWLSVHAETAVQTKTLSQVQNCANAVFCFIVWTEKTEIFFFLKPQKNKQTMTFFFCHFVCLESNGSHVSHVTHLIRNEQDGGWRAALVVSAIRFDSVVKD